MALQQWGSFPADTQPIVITNLHLNQNEYCLWKGVPGYEDQVTLADNVDGTFRLQPNVAPVSPAQLFQVRDASSNIVAYVKSDGSAFFTSINIGGGQFPSSVPILAYTQTLSVSTPTIGFNLPTATYNNIRIEATLRTDFGGGSVDIVPITMNQDLNGDYAYQNRFTTDNSVAWNNQQAQAAALPYIMVCPTAMASPNIYGSGTVFIDNYSSSTIAKSGHAQSWAPDLSADGGLVQNVSGFTWMQTATVNSVILGPPGHGANFVAGSVIRVYLDP